MHGYHWKPTAGWNPRPWLSGCWKLSNSSARRQVRFVIGKSGLFLSYSRRHHTQIDIDRYAMTSKRKLWTSTHLVTRKFIDYGTASLQTNRVLLKSPMVVMPMFPATAPGTLYAGENFMLRFRFPARDFVAVETWFACWKSDPLAV